MEYRFTDCTLDTSTHTLTRDGAAVHVEPQVFSLLLCLVEADGALVSYDTLIEQVWGGRIVSDATLATRISAARAAVGDTGKAQAVIRTVPRRGVQLVVPIESPGTRPAPTHIRQTIRYTTSRDGTGIAWAESGDGPPLVRGGHWLGHLEHDWASPVWRPLLEHFSSRHRLVRYDPRGTGLSDRQLNGATVEQLADDMEAVADAAGLERFPIFATSQSVPVSLTLAARRPDRVSRMILLNGLVQGTDATGDPAKTATMVGMIQSGWGVPGSAFMQALATVFMPTATREEVGCLVTMQALSATPDIAAGIRQLIGGIDVTPILEKITCPVLIMHCTGDSVQDPEQSRLLARTVSGASYHTLDSPNHVLVPSDPIWAPCLEECDRFLAEDPAP